jgi:iron complex transport system ATP-binding protein
MPFGDETDHLTHVERLSSEEGRFASTLRWCRGGRTSSSQPTEDDHESNLSSVVPRCYRRRRRAHPACGLRRERVRRRGRDVSAMRRPELARLMAYVPQQPQFPADMTAGDYVMLGRTPHVRPLRTLTTTDRAVCTNILVRLNLADFAQRTLATLSGGERQKLVLARALAQQAPVLLLDEPTSALDLGRRIDAMELVDELREEMGLTVVHDLTLAGQFVHTLALIHEGRLVATGTPAQVLREETLSPVYGVTVRVLEDSGRSVVTSHRREPSAAEEIR